MPAGSSWWRQSGQGTGGIGYTMADMTQEKMAVIAL